MQTSIVVTTFQGDFQLQAFLGPHANLQRDCSSLSLPPFLTHIENKLSAELTREGNNQASASYQPKVPGTGGFPTRPGQGLGKGMSLFQGTAWAGVWHHPCKPVWSWAKVLPTSSWRTPPLTVRGVVSCLPRPFTERKWSNNHSAGFSLQTPKSKNAMEVSFLWDNDRLAKTYWVLQNNSTNLGIYYHLYLDW